jgi:twitching motility protein PilT
MPRMDGKGRAVACEILINTPTIRDLILQNNVGEIRDYMAEGRNQYGMQTFDQHLAEMVTQGMVSFEVALAASTRPADFELQMSVFKKSSRDMNQPQEGFGGDLNLSTNGGMWQ